MSHILQPWHSFALAQQLYQKLYPSVKIFQNSTNKGVVYSMNRGIELSMSDFIIFKSADDICLPNFFQTAMDLLEQNPQADICSADHIYFEDNIKDGHKESLNLSQKNCFIPVKKLIEIWNPDNMLPGGSCIVRRIALIKVGGFFEEVKWYSDWLTFLILGFKNGLCYCPTPFTGSRLNSESYGNSQLMNEEIQNKVYIAILEVLEMKSPEILGSFARTGALEIFGPSMVNAYLDESKNWSINRLHLMQRPIARWFGKETPANNSNSGIGLVIKETLSKNKKLLSHYFAELKKPSILVYGAGLHTDKLLTVWSDFDFPNIKAIVTTNNDHKKTDQLGIPIKSLSKLEMIPDLIIISSKSFEGDMVKTCEDLFPNTPRIAFWATNRSLLPKIK